MTFFLIIIIAIVIPSLIIVLTLKVSRRLGYKKVGITISIFIALFILAIPFSFLYDGLIFSKKDAIEQLQEHNIILIDNCSLIHKKITGVMDYNLQFRLEISDSDKEQIINKFQESKYLINVDSNELFDIRPRGYIPRDSKTDSIIYAVYEEENFWNLQYCKLLANGYVQTWDLIQVSKNANTINFIRNQ